MGHLFLLLLALILLASTRAAFHANAAAFAEVNSHMFSVLLRQLLAISPSLCLSLSDLV